MSYFRLKQLYDLLHSMKKYQVIPLEGVFFTKAFIHFDLRVRAAGVLWLLSIYMCVVYIHYFFTLAQNIIKT